MSLQATIKKFPEYANYRNIIKSVTEINIKAKFDLTNNFTNLIYSHLTISRLNYMAHSSKDFSLDELFIPLKNPQMLSTSQKNKMFTKATASTQFPSLIHILKENPDFFAQVIYFAGLSQNNFDSNCQITFTEDDITYLCFSTFPSIYNFFMTQNDKKSAINLISNLFDLHLYLHGPNFGKPHRFLSYFVSAFFHSTNPGLFFESSVQPTFNIDSFAQKMKKNRYQYKNINGSLIRAEYWELCIVFAKRLMKKMIFNAPLLPNATRQLINDISSMFGSFCQKHPDAKQFPFEEIFIFEAMICDYLENKLLTIDATIMHDICDVIRCSYPQSIISSPIFLEINLVKPTNFSEIINVSNVINALKFNCNDEINSDYMNDNMQMSLVISYISRDSFFLTPRDLTLLYRSIELFLKYAENTDDDPKTSILKIVSIHLKTIGNPNFDLDDKYIEYQAWNSGSTKAKRKISVKNQNSNEYFNTIIDTLTFLNSDNIHFNNSKELCSQVLLYGNIFLSDRQRILVNLESQDFQIGFDCALKNVEDIVSQLNQISSDLFTSLYYVDAYLEMNKNQINRLLKLHIDYQLLPTLHELFPRDFIFSSKDLFSAKNRNNVKKVYKALEAHVKPLNIPESNYYLIQKSLVMLYIDQIDNSFDFQKITCNSQIFNSFSKYIKSKSSLIQEANFTCTTKATEHFKAIHFMQPPSKNIIFALNAMRILKYSSNDLIKLTIAISHNESIFSLITFIRTYVMNEKIAKSLFTSEEKNLLKRLIDNVIELRSIL